MSKIYVENRYHELVRKDFELKKWCLFHQARLKLLYQTIGLSAKIAYSLANVMVHTHKKRRIIWGNARGKSLTGGLYWHKRQAT